MAVSVVSLSVFGISVYLYLSCGLFHLFSLCRSFCVCLLVAVLCFVSSFVLDTKQSEEYERQTHIKRDRSRLSCMKGTYSKETYLSLFLERDKYEYWLVFCKGQKEISKELSCCVASYRVVSCLVLSCLVVLCLVLSCLVLSRLVLSCLVLSCRVLSCLVLSCRVVSCLVGYELSNSQ